MGLEDGTADILAHVLAGRLADGTGRLSPEVIAAARRHRVHLLVANALSNEERADPALSELTRDLQRAAAREVRSDEALIGLLNALHDHGVDAVLMKGAGLAHTIYAPSHLRVRADTDILIPHEHLDRAEDVLFGQGWERPAERSVRLTAAQYHYSRRTGLPHHIDLHWRIANPVVFGHALSFGELRSRAVAVPALGAHARALAPADALFVACLHRVAHHDDEIQLLWLWDIHRLIESATPGMLDTFVRLAERERMCAVCARGVKLSADYFLTPSAASIAGALSDRATEFEASARFIRGNLAMTTLQSDLRHIHGWRGRLAYLSEHLFPSRIYMRSRYPSWPAVLLPVAYAHRIVRGAPKWFGR